MLRFLSIFALCLLAVPFSASASAQEAATTNAPAPPPPVVRESGLLTRFPGYPYDERRSVAALDLGLALTGRSPVGYAGGLPFFYLDLAGTYSNRFVFLEARTMGIPWLVDALTGIGLINLNLVQSDDFPPFRQILNPDGNHGVWEIANFKGGFVFAASETTSWIYGFQSHLLVYGEPLGIQAGFGAALTRLWIHPTWDLLATLNAGPEIGSEIGGYGGLDLVWRRALAAGFAGFLRWNAVGHFAPSGLSSHGQLEAGISFGNWK